MLAVFTTLACEIAAAVLRLAFAHWFNEAPGLAMFAGVMFFAALVLGAVSMLLLGAVLWIRKQPVPRGVLVFATVVSLAPWVAIFLLAGGGQ